MLRPTSRRSRWWLAIVQVVILVASLGVPVAAQTAPSNVTGAQLVDLLRTYGVVKGDETGNLHLDRPITRAEMFTIIVRAMGLESQVNNFRGLGIFDDARDHWADGYIGLAAARGIVRGDGNRMVRPDDPVNWAEALTLVVRVVGKEPTTGDWPVNILVAALDLGIVPPGVTLANARMPAVRGTVFESMAKALVTVTTPEGKTIFQANLPPVPPTISLGQLPATTQNSTISVTGTAQNAVSVTVNGATAQLVGSTFTANVALTPGVNTIAVVARDLAGNQSTATASITRALPIASLTVTGPGRVGSGTTATYSVVARDGNNNSVSTEGIQVAVEGNIGSFNAATGVLTAAGTAAKGKLTFSTGTVSTSIEVEVLGPDATASRLVVRTVNDGRAVSFTRPMTVEIEVQDADGRHVETDYTRNVSLSATGVTGLIVTPTAAQTSGGVARFTVQGSAMGTVSLVATSSGLASGLGTAQFGSNLRVVLSATPTSLAVGGATSSSRIRATLVNEDGNAVANNTDTDITVVLSASGNAGFVTDDSIRIFRGNSSSQIGGDEGLFTIGAAAGTSTITGAVTSGQILTVDSVSVTTTVPSIGTGTTWDIIAPSSMAPGVERTFTIRLADASGHTIPGNYAFQLSVSTSNNETKVSGIPTGLTITLGDTGLNPISDGIAEGASGDGNDVVVRTDSGVAEFKIEYNKPGEIYISVVPMGATSTAYRTDGVAGSALSSLGISSRTFTVAVTETPTAVKLLVDSDGLGNKQTVGAVLNNPARTFTLRAYLTDSSGNWVPRTSGSLALVHVATGSTTPPSAMNANASDGQATFTVRATTTTGTDTYRVTWDHDNNSGTPPIESDLVSLQVQSAVPAQPVILAVRGIKDGIPGTINHVAPDDTGMEIELARDSDQKYVVVKVYRENNNTVTYTSDPIDLSDVAPRIVVPKSALPNGLSRFQVAVRNGAGDSTRSLVSNQVANAQFVTNIRITAARYQIGSKTLTITGSGFGTSDTVYPGLMYLSDVSTGESIDLGGAQVTINNSSQMTLNLTGLSILSTLEDPEKFAGSDVLITTGAAWYVRTNGEQSAAISDGSSVTPFARIRHVVYDRANNRLILVGEGFTKVSLNFTKLSLIAGDDQNPTQALSGYSNTRNSDTQWTITLSGTAGNTLKSNLDQNATYELDLQSGWAFDGSFLQGVVSSIPVYAQVNVTSVSYTRRVASPAAPAVLRINGSGFTGGSVAIGSIQVRDLSTGQTRTLSGTPAVVSDTQINLTLNQSVSDDLENATLFQGSDIYVLASPGWFTNSDGRDAADIPLRTIRLVIPNP
jgi:hypothetical protein